MDPSAAPVRFPPPSTADETGLVAVGGRLDPEWLVAAYSAGIFPWPLVEGRCELLAWFSPDPRAILPLDRFHVSRRLARRLRRGEFHPTCDQDFAGVVGGCREPRRPGDQTWITESMRRAYERMHELGYAHSVEVWQAGRLVGGVYGVALGGYFAGESMFHRVRDASKAALYYLVRHLQARGYVLFDVQQATPHLLSLGAVEIPRRRFLRQLRRAVRLPVAFGPSLEIG